MGLRVVGVGPFHAGGQQSRPRSHRRGCERQSGSVFFLAGTFGAEPVVRNVTVESGKALFIPIVNWNQTYPEDVAKDVPRDQAEAAMRANLNAFFDTVDPKDMRCEVDGVALGNLLAYRAQSPVYSMYFAPDSIPVTMPGWGYAAGEHDLNVSDGYWVMLAPLSVGNHTIRVRYASYLDVTYHLTVQAGANVSGRLAADWWQWVLGIPADVNPLLDQTGANAAIGQSGPVWFLAGTTGGIVERTITVPAGKSLFFPLVNNVWISTPGDPPWRRPYTDPTTGEAYRSFEQYVRMVLLKPATDSATVSCEVDGQPVVGVRCQSPTFQVKLPNNNLFGVDRGVYGPSADDGIYVLLPPLPPGNHTIHFTAAQSDGSWALDLTCHLTVKPAKK